MPMELRFDREEFRAFVTRIGFGAMHADEMVLETVETRQELVALSDIVFTLGLGTVVFAIAAFQLFLVQSLGRGHHQAVNFPLSISTKIHYWLNSASKSTATNLPFG